MAEEGWAYLQLCLPSVNVIRRLVQFLQLSLWTRENNEVGIKEGKRRKLSKIQKVSETNLEEL